MWCQASEAKALNYKCILPPPGTWYYFALSIRDEAFLRDKTFREPHLPDACGCFHRPDDEANREVLSYGCHALRNERSGFPARSRQG